MQEITIGKIKELQASSKEAFKTLKTNISFCGSHIKSILITSSTPNEGKTTIAFNLCNTLAKDHKRVLYIDADLRNSSFNKDYDVSSDVSLYGLSNYLVHQADYQDIIYRTNIHYLDVILAGPSAPNPTFLLESDSFPFLISKVKDVYDYIIIDTPPLGSVIDSAILATSVDGAILVIEKDEISYRTALSTKKQLEKSKCRILGAVLNKTEKQADHYYHHDENYQH